MIQPFSSFGRFCRRAFDYGFVDTFFHLLHRLRIISVLHSFNLTVKELGVRDGVLFLNSLDDVAGSKVCEMNGLLITLREIEEGELESLNFGKEMFSVEAFREHFTRGMRFFAVFHEGVVIAVNGIHTKYAHLAYIKLPVVRLPKGVTYINCALTSPDYRNLGIGTLLRTFVMNKMWKEGYKSVVGAVFTDNLGALRWNSSNGFRYWGKIYYVRWLGKDFWFKQLTKVGKRNRYLLDDVVATNELVSKLSAEVAL